MLLCTWKLYLKIQHAAVHLEVRKWHEVSTPLLSSQGVPLLYWSYLPNVLFVSNYVCTFGSMNKQSFIYEQYTIQKTHVVLYLASYLLSNDLCSPPLLAICRWVSVSVFRRQVRVRDIFRYRAEFIAGQKKRSTVMACEQWFCFRWLCSCYFV